MPRRARTDPRQYSQDGSDRPPIPIAIPTERDDDHTNYAHTTSSSPPLSTSTNEAPAQESANEEEDTQEPRDWDRLSDDSRRRTGNRRRTTYIDRVVIDNNSHVFNISTTGNPTRVRDFAAGEGSTFVNGQMSDASVQELTRFVSARLQSRSQTAQRTNRAF